MASSAGTVMSHWYHLVEGLQHSPQQFYASLEEAINRRDIPGVTLSRTDYLEGGAFSARREYLRAKRKELVFDICASPFGKGFFISWWLAESRSKWGPLIAVAMLGILIVIFYLLIKSIGLFLGSAVALLVSVFGIWNLSYLIRVGAIPLEISLSEIPIFGTIYSSFFERVTYYKVDTTLMFQEAIHLSVLEVVDEATKAKGLRALSELERKPVLHKLLKK